MQTETPTILNPQPIDLDAVARHRAAASVGYVPTPEAPTEISPSTAMAALLVGKPTYEGTVPAATIAKRRAANKRARRARRAHRR